MTDTRPHFYFDYEAEGLTSLDYGGYKVCGENLDNSKFYLIIDHEDDTVYEIFYELTNFISSDFYSIVDIYETIDPSNFQDIENVPNSCGEYSEIHYLGQINCVIDDDEIYVGELEEEPSAPSTTWIINNKTVQSLVIGNKEVQSIVRVSDNTVIYNASSTALTFTNSTYAVQNDNATIQCTLTEDNSPLANETISLTGSDNSAYFAITNNNGIATFNLTHSTGTDLTFVASYGSCTDTCTVEGYLNPTIVITWEEDEYDVTNHEDNHNHNYNSSYGNNGIPITFSIKYADNAKPKC